MSLVSLNHCNSSSAVIANSCRISSYKHGHKTVSHAWINMQVILLYIISGYFSSSQEGAASLYTIADGGLGDWLGGFLYSSGQQANDAVQDQLSVLSFTRVWQLYLGRARYKPFSLHLGYIGAFGSGKSRAEVVGDSVAFALGLATTLAIQGVAASFAEKAYGQIGQGLPVAASGVAVIMGLNLLEIKGRPMKRSKTARKMKAIAKAISKSEKSVEKVLKTDNKTSRTQAAKFLYD